ncbi:organic cation transporter protein [Elysia marginata]|uniref:Organic cation transporter protein n=1 Tax=Elysia marginata TaxID=1093978 RepID=A0AAV4HI92_9GAST|nr:organic cation transporter protein [Elysia marginata]
MTVPTGRGWPIWFSCVVRCALPNLPNDTYASQGSWHEALINDSIPWNKKEEIYEECKIRDDSQLNDDNSKSCEKYVYSKDPFLSTFVTDTNLICDDKSLVTYASMILMCGMLFGSFVLGILSDIVGRRKVLILSTFCMMACSLGVAWADSYTVFVIVRFLTSFFGTGIMLTSFVIGMEVVGPSKRRIAGNVVNFFWVLGVCTLTAVAYLLRHWRHLQMATSIPPAFALLLFLVFLPESPRWLIQKGRTEEAIQIVQKIAAGNGVVLTDTACQLEEMDKGGEERSIWLVFKHKVLFIRTLVMFFNWLVASMVYYGLSLNVGQFSGNIYLNSFLSAMAELLSYVFCLCVLDITGRKLLLCSTMLLGGLACVSTMFPVLYGGDDIQWVTLFLSLIGKFGITVGFAVVYVYAVELFPTAMRNSALGLCSFNGRIGGILAPYIGALDGVLAGGLGIALPLLIFGALSITAGLLVLFLPETRNTDLPETLEDAKKFGKSHSSSTANFKLESIISDAYTGIDNRAFSIKDKELTENE